MVAWQKSYIPSSTLFDKLWLAQVSGTSSGRQHIILFRLGPGAIWRLWIWRLWRSSRRLWGRRRRHRVPPSVRLHCSRGFFSVVWLLQEPRWRCIRYAPRADFSATTEALVDGKSYSSGFLRYCLECVVLCVSFPAFAISASRHAQWCSLHSMGI